MLDKITLILILHNRHRNLDRLLEYYRDFPFPILIADSSAEAHQFSQKQSNWNYSYTPGVSFAQKIEIVSQQVTTPYVAMCADDDFLVPEGVLSCVSFLENNPGYSIAQGMSIRYEKESIARGAIEYGAIYNHINSVEAEEPLRRLHDIFADYRGLVYAVFRTHALREAYRGAGLYVKNLYLNEYITAFLPILFGKYKELPLLYQVREYALDSDDKTALDVDALLREPRHEGEVRRFEAFIASRMTEIIGIDQQQAAGIVRNIILRFAEKVHSIRSTVSFKKRVGNLVKHIPVAGSWLISKNRSLENKRRLKAYIDIGKEEKEIQKISNLLLQYSVK